MDKNRWEIRRLFCDWHMPDFLPEIKLDAEYFIKKAIETGGQSLTFMCKNAFGNCLYPSKVAVANKSIKGDGDIFGKVCRLAKEKGLKFIAYYNMLLDDTIGRNHPEWIQKDKDGHPLKMENYRILCMNSPYREYVFHHIEEIVSLFDIDGLMFDIQYFRPNGCFCRWCKEKFFKMYKYPLEPYTLNSIKNLFDFYEFKKKSRRDFILTAIEKAKKIKPDLLFTWNGGGADNHLDSFANFLGGEAHPPAYLACLLKAKRFQALKKPFELWMPESIGSWGHWTLTNADTLKGMSAIALSHGGAIGFNHVPVPCGDYSGKVMPAVYKTLKEVMSWVKKREKFVIGKKPFPVAAILLSSRSCFLKDFKDILDKKLPHYGDMFPDLQNLQSAVQLLQENSIPVDILDTEISLERIDEYEIIILPDIKFVDTKTAEKIYRYVEKGGKILVTYDTSLYNDTGQQLPNFYLAEILGADFLCFSDYSVIYIDSFHPLLKKNLPDMPLLVKSAGYQQNPSEKAIYCKLRPNAQKLATFTEPVIESNWEKGYHIYHDHAPPGNRTNHPAIILNKIGKGLSIFMPFPILQAQTFQSNIWFRNLIKSVFEYIKVPSSIKIEAPSSVNVVVNSDNQGLYIHLIHIQKETNSIFLDSTAVSAPIKCVLTLGKKVKQIENAVTKEKIKASEVKGKISFTIPGVKTYEIIRLSFYKT